MEWISKLPTAPLTFIDHDDNRLVLAFADGLAVLNDTTLDFVVRESIDSAARGSDGRFYYTRGEQICCCNLASDNTPQDISSAFAGNPQGQLRITCTPTGDIWVEGCTTRRDLNGTFQANPTAPNVPAPAPYALDVYGNFWSLVDGPTGRQVLVLPANASDAWQVAWLTAGSWEYLLADSVGYIWVAGPDGWRRCCPRRIADGWQAIADPLPTSPVTAMGLSPAGLIMAAFATGELLELDTNPAGETLIRPLATLADIAHCIHTDRGGAIWAATNDGLYRQEATADAWQKNWQKQRGRLPGGGNHDIFSVECLGQLYVAGGWAGAWGLPPEKHVLDELFAYEPQSEYWTIVSRMRMPRRYNGIAAMEDRVWIIGGETRIPDWAGEGQVLYTVEIYDPPSATWSPGPALNIARTDPFVVSCNGRIYAIGGAAHNSGPKLDSVESIGPGESAWRFETPLPEPTRQGHSCVLDGIIYCASIDGVFAFDPVSGRWDDDLPQPGTIGQGPLAAGYRGEVWLIGGINDTRIRCYNPQTKAWRAGPDLPVGQAWGGATVFNDQLTIVGGAHHSAVQDVVVYDDSMYILRDNPDNE